MARAIQRCVYSTDEYHEAVEAAETLGLETAIRGFTHYGWLKPDGDEFLPEYVPEIVSVSEEYVRFDCGDPRGFARARFAHEDELDQPPAWIRLEFIDPDD